MAADRRAFLALVGGILPACSATDDPETAAMSFLLAYVQRGDHASAMAYAAGDARTRLEGEARDVQASRAQGFSGGPPSLDIRLVSSEPLAPKGAGGSPSGAADRRILHYSLTPKGLEAREITVECEKTVQGWKVSRFEFAK